MATSAKISLAAGDKSELVLRGLRDLVSDTFDLELVVTATDAERFVDACARYRFDVGIVGWVMAYGGGRAVLEGLAEQPQPPRIIVYTGDEDPALPGLAMRLGAAAFCPKSEPPARLVEAIRAVASGKMVFPISRTRTLDQDPLGTLTEREHQLLSTLAEGRTNAEMARDYDLSVNTVKYHLRNLYEKLQVRNRAEATAMLLSRGVRR